MSHKVQSCISRSSKVVRIHCVITNKLWVRASLHMVEKKNENVFLGADVCQISFSERKFSFTDLHIFKLP